jgi:primosomal protein N'
VRHLGSHFWERFNEEVCRSHAGLHRAERMLDCLATSAHSERVRISDVKAMFLDMKRLSRVK